MSTGSSASMRHMNKNQNINFKWLKQQFVCNQFDLLNVGTSYQVADILTKAFTRPALWQHATQLIGIGPTKVGTTRGDAEPTKLATAVGNQGGPTKDVPRMLIEFCCSKDSKLSTPRKVNENCRCIRVTEKEDGTQASCRQRLASLVQDFKNEFKATVLFGLLAENPFWFALTTKLLNLGLKVMFQFWMIHARSSQKTGIEKKISLRSSLPCRPRSRALHMKSRTMKSYLMNSCLKTIAMSTPEAANLKTSSQRQPVQSISSRISPRTRTAEHASEHV